MSLTRARSRNSRNRPRLIAIEGCIGAGKSTLASVLSNKMNASQILEDTERHPFLQAFYNSPAEHAFETELGFVLLHYHQLKHLSSERGSNRIVLSDFAFEKDEIFPRLTLRSRTERQHFAAIYQELKNRVPAPQTIVYIRCSTEFLMERIRRRGRPYEARISFKYLDMLNKAYDRHFLGRLVGSEVISIEGPDLEVKPGRRFEERLFRRWRSEFPTEHWLARVESHQ
jgi:deoxyguanosine kinase